MTAGLPGPALLVLDVFNTFEFPGGDALFRETLDIVEQLRELAQRFRVAGMPVIFINDNLQRWQDDFDEVIAHVGASGEKGAVMTTALQPLPGDFRLLKPRHSAFFETALPSLLAHLNIREVVVCGIAADSCVLSTVMDAHVRGIKTTVPMDATASQTRERTERVLSHLRESCEVATPLSSAFFA